ncbi:RecA-superfamily ATPase possibly involved in signal transduction [Candidatus Methanoperedens nitroreducens]|uniref:RecA-superfamily ATPase possibly involved in signal transduction n=1 Tax=Candidatus Methanoperedens nitratireducens TaxID=1392998 RepID=A0A062V187_9EURY|nr:ATPase domain-containing protein [Candidatus Methanoperedens nitroreducens]KCZ71147.1 RecA-superfamily ATPase possibly involved in signal transduction [Candidatus Methanoperedens nitroreducens]MDJ1421475.1 ATPase domain-containing protein [Candidatus Methanoperedens sp.]
MRVKTGIEGFDGLIEGGLLQGRQYLISGSPGSGKTTFGAQFLATGALVGEAGAYVALSESVGTIIEDMSRYNLFIQEFIKRKKLFFLDIGPASYGDNDRVSMVITPNYEQQVTESPEIAPPSPYSVFENVEMMVKQYGIRRLVIDSLSSIRFTSHHPALEERSIGRFIRNLKSLGCTTLLLSELTRPDAYTIEQFASHGVVFLHNFMDRQGNMVRALQIIKMRGTKHDCEMRGIEFTDKGLKVLKPIKR